MRLLSILAISLLSVTAFAQTTWYVSPTGTGNGTSAATPLGSIQAAINAASSNDIIELSSGTYSGSQFYGNTISGKSLTIRGDLNSPKPIVNGLGQDYFFLQCGPATAITITNLALSSFVRPSSLFGAIRVHQVGTAHITDLDISNCVTSGFGGAIFVDGTTNVSIESCSFSMNSVVSGPAGVGYGGAVCFMGAGINGGEASISDSTFVSNTSGI